LLYLLTRNFSQCSFMGQATQRDCLTFEDEADNLTRNGVIKHPFHAA
jgi:hypothetical protein